MLTTCQTLNNQIGDWFIFNFLSGFSIEKAVGVNLVLIFVSMRSSQHFSINVKTGYSWHINPFAFISHFPHQIVLFIALHTKLP